MRQTRESRTADGGEPGDPGDQDRRPYREFGAWLRARRLARRWTQEELATRLSYDVTYVRKIEWGARKATEGFRARLAEAFELPVESLPDPAGGPSPAPGLPAPATSFVGRQREVDDVSRRLQDEVRLVTLLGAPGIGKTRLAIAVAARLDESLEHGARFVPLVGAGDAARVAATICEAVGLRPASGHGAERLLVDHLRDQELLLVLDNFEHVLDASSLVGALLAGAPRLRVLVTSREPLRVAGESQFPVPPLGSGGPGDAAVELFVERARLVRPDFSLAPADVDAVARICRRLDGVPFAIELTAAAARLMSPAELLGELDHVLDLPTKGPVDVPAHQQTLRATIDWSYQLLDEGERILFARLGVFVGGFRRDAAVAVCVGAGVDRATVVAGVASLVSKSLLETRTGVGGGSRFVPLEAIRAYALERLAERQDADDLRSRHAAHYAAFAETAEAQLTGRDQATWLDALGDEHANLVAALDWALAHEPATALRLAGALWRFWLLRGYFTEGRKWLEQALATPPPADDPARVGALIGAGVLARAQGDYERADNRFAEAADLARRLGHGEELALTLQNSGIVAENQGRYDAAAALFEESLALYRATGNDRGVGHALNALGNIALDRGDEALAASCFERALAAFRNLEDQWSIALVYTNLGWVAQVTGDTTRARTWYGHSLALHRTLGHQRGIANTLCNIGRVAAMEGDTPSARAYLEEALLQFRRLGERRGMAECFEQLAPLAVAEGDLGRAARLCSAAEALRAAIGIPPLPTELEAQRRTLDSVRTGLDRKSFDEAWTDGQGMSTEAAISLALTRPGRDE